MHIKEHKTLSKKASNVKQSPSKKSLPIFVELLHIPLMPFQPLFTQAAFDLRGCHNSGVIGALMRGVGTL